MDGRIVRRALECLSQQIERLALVADLEQDHAEGVGDLRRAGGDFCRLARRAHRFFSLAQRPPQPGEIAQRTSVVGGSEVHTSDLQELTRNSYAGFSLTKKI